MATPKFNSKSPTIRRILREAQELSSSPSPDYTATPLESDLFEWHFTFRGPPNSSYSEGIYHGRIVLPPTYPLRPPSFRFLTPSGRFETNREICLSISGHHEETWQPAWGVRTALVALRSFMETDPRGQLGGLETSDAVRKRHAMASHTFKCPTCAKSNIEIIQECEESAKANSDSPDSATEVEIPSELKLGYKDEMAESKGSKGESTAAVTPVPPTPRTEPVDTESAELAEGFVRTAPETVAAAPSSATTSQSPATAASYPPARPGQGIIAPTRTVSLPPAPNLSVRPQVPPTTRAYDEGVPLWVDRAIVVLVVLLLAMILKVLLDF
ncbi:ubiquitin-conjugating enzyme/RWD-like protein [Colletotrichum phormii]|uniref:Ubiquitin-conjugating enzyme/RWD-like protein n=1 Tax=Colletotrichum phormii TaxID=359342 RepID=A0AAJ0A637_9PEZI|nr:ubiquitin-conjugating enzyme/RWD-like protein [Colletotrichum phormii]KAK1655751.1 ubiquitin-conjugating enzyme/RWD-like protein [Colletotrichum phormii]